MIDEINMGFGLEANIDNKNRVIIPALIRERVGLLPHKRIFIQKLHFGKILISTKEPEEYISVIMDDEFRIVLPKKAGLDEFFDAGKVRVLEIKGGKGFVFYPSLSE